MDYRSQECCISCRTGESRSGSNRWSGRLEVSWTVLLRVESVQMLMRSYVIQLFYQESHIQAARYLSNSSPK